VSDGEESDRERIHRYLRRYSFEDSDVEEDVRSLIDPGIRQCAIWFKSRAGGVLLALGKHSFIETVLGDSSNPMAACDMSLSTVFGMQGTVKTPVHGCAITRGQVHQTKASISANIVILVSPST
jgi:hypothetical protein